MPCSAPVQSAGDVASAAARLRALPPLSAAELPELIHAICQACMRLLGTDRQLAQALRHDLAEATRSSPEMIEWGLTTTLSSVRPDVLEGLAREAAGTPGLQAVPARLVAVVLAGNVFSAAARAMLLPLLSGAPVLVKAASTDDVLPRYLQQALAAVEPEIGRRCEVVRFSRSDPAAREALLARAEVVSIYGDDATVRALAQAAPAAARLLRHGHGLSAAFVSADALPDSASLRDVAQRIALDVAAYDQRGCLSPHMVFVESGGRREGRALARQLHAVALPQLEQVLPAGPADTSDKAAALQWRAAAQMRGELLDGGTFAVSYEHSHPPRPSPGNRLVSVYDCAGPWALPDALAAYGGHLKCIGVAGERGKRLEVARAIRRLAPARVCRAGDMQTPPFDAYTEGQPPLAGLLSFVETQ